MPRAAVATGIIQRCLVMGIRGLLSAPAESIAWIISSSPSMPPVQWRGVSPHIFTAPSNISVATPPGVQVRIGCRHRGSILAAAVAGHSGHVERGLSAVGIARLALALTPGRAGGTCLWAASISGEPAAHPRIADLCTLTDQARAISKCSCPRLSERRDIVEINGVDVGRLRL